MYILFQACVPDEVTEPEPIGKATEEDTSEAPAETPAEAPAESS